MDVGDWITVLRSLKWLSSPRWLLVEAVADNDRRMECDPEAQGSSSNRQDAPQRGEELADDMCAGTVIRSPHLTRILYNFISGEGLLPFSLGDKQLVSTSSAGFFILNLMKNLT